MQHLKSASKLWSELRDLQFFQFYGHFQYNISWISAMSADATYIENGHKFERTEDSDSNHNLDAL